MLQERKKVHIAYLLVDILLIGLSFYVPYVLRYNHNLIPRNLISLREYGMVFALWGITLIFTLNNYHLYATDRTLTIPAEIWRVVKAVFYASTLAVLTVFGLKIGDFSRLVFGASAALLLISLSSWRALKRLWIRSLIIRGNPNLNVNVLIVGAGKSGQALVDEIEDNPYLGLKVIGFLDDNKTGKVSGFSILGKISDLDEVIRRHFIEEIYVTIPSERQKVSEVLFHAKRLGRTVRIVADTFNYPYFSRVGVDYIEFTPLITYHEKGLHASEQFIKRFMDIAFSAAGLILLSPVFLVIILAIKLNSPGQVFYISKRCGKKSKVFNFYKFRSMYKDADKHKESLRHKSEVKGPIFKIKEDPRITSVGSFLRKYSLDELPQLINVFKGDMSLVGPRPPTPDEVEKYDLWHMRRLEIRPGITCLWQVRGRSDLSFYKWVKWDLWYIDNWSVGLDLQILFWTIPAVFKSKGAY